MSEGGSAHMRSSTYDVELHEPWKLARLTWIKPAVKLV